MTLNRRSAVYAESTDSDVAEERIQAYGLTAEVEATNVTHGELVQYQATDWDFILTRADANGHIVLVDDGEVVIKPPESGAEVKLSLGYGSALVEFEAEFDARAQLEGAAQETWVPADQAMAEETGADSEFPDQGNVAASDLVSATGRETSGWAHPAQLAAGESKAWVDAAVARSRLSKIRGRARCQGTAVIKPGDLVELVKVGERFSGEAFVSAVRHQLVKNNWQTHIQIGLDKEWYHERQQVQAPPAGGLLPGTRGLQIGVVVQLQDDPLGDERILVRIPGIDGEAEGQWARYAVPDAGDNRGVVWRPEIGDEVVLGFLFDDPRHPVVLGGFHSAAKASPEELAPSDDNHIKGIVTRSELRTVYDDEKNIIQITTPSGNTVELNEEDGSILLEDENSNKILMDSSGILIESASDVIIKASGDIKLEGTNISNTASAEFTAEGSAGAKLASSAIAKVEGSLVQIN